MTKLTPASCLATIFLVYGEISYTAEEAGHHLPHNHLALIVGHAEERLSNGHQADGKVWGLDYTRQYHEHWGWGLTIEQEGFRDNDNRRHGIVAVPVSYFISERWRVFAAPGIEFHNHGDPDEPMFRIGTGYEFALGNYLTLSPEVQVDFIPGGTRVYVFVLAFGYGF